MNTENRARKEIEETKILVDYLIHNQLDFNNIENFSNRRVKQALEWFKGRQENDRITAYGYFQEAMSHVRIAKVMMAKHGEVLAKSR